MDWTRFPCGFRLEPIAHGSPEALVVVLHDFHTSTELTTVATRWAAALPTTTFILLDGVEQLGLLPHELAVAPTGLSPAARHLERGFDRKLSAHGYDAQRVVLVGFGYGGSLALYMAVNRGWGCAGALAFEGNLTLPLPPLLRIDTKVRLIKSFATGPFEYGALHAETNHLIDRGIDARGVVLRGPTLSDEAARHGGAYLVELVAHAHRHGRQT